MPNIDFVEHLIEECDVGELKILEAHYAQIGCFYFSENKTIRRVKYPASALNSSDPFLRIDFDYFQKIIEDLQKCPYTKEMREVYIKSSTAERSFELGSFISGSGFDIKFNIPADKLGYQARETTKSEIFSVFTLGSLYLAYEKMGKEYSRGYFANEFKIIFEKFVAANSEIKPVTIGPSPLHIDVFFIKIEEEVLNTLSKNIFCCDESIVVFYSREDLQSEVFLFLRGEEKVLMNHYILQLERCEMMLVREEIDQRIKDLRRHFLVIRKASFFDIFQFIKVEKLISQDLTKLYELLFLFDEKEKNFDRSKKQLASSLLKNSCFGDVKDYFLEDMGDNDLKFSMEPLYRAIGYFEEEVRSLKSYRVQLITSVLGGLVGGLLSSQLIVRIFQ